MFKSFSNIANKVFDQKNIHSTHLEDLLITNRYDGFTTIKQVLYDFSNHLTSDSNDIDYGVTVKIDGAPAMVFGTDPSNGKFFVGTKSVFNKNTPIINYSIEDIKKNHEGSLSIKLINAYNQLKDITPVNRVYQGDFLFSIGDVSMKTICDIRYSTFHPNTIMYAVEHATLLGQAIHSQYTFCIAVHTEYIGNSLESVVPTFGVDISDFATSESVLLLDVDYKLFTGAGNFTKAESGVYNRYLSNITNTILTSEVYDFLNANSKILMRYINYNIRDGIDFDPVRLYDMFVSWLELETNKKATKLKTEVAKDRALLAHISIIDDIPGGDKTWMRFFKLYSEIHLAKNMIIHKLSDMSHYKTFVMKTDGSIEATSHEGFVGVHGDFAGVKLVDRFEFSKNNFSEDILKGFSR